MNDDDLDQQDQQPDTGPANDQFVVRPDDTQRRSAAPPYPGGATDTLPPQQQQQSPQPSWTDIATQLPFGQEDARQLQLYSNGIGQVKGDLAAGRIDDDTANQMFSKLVPTAVGLAQRKQQSDQSQEDRMYQAALKGAAHAQSVKGLNMKANADNFAHTVFEHYNPNTGGIDTYYQDEEGKFKLHPGEIPDPPEQSTAGESDRAIEPSGQQPTNGPPLTQDQIAAGGMVLPDGTVSYRPGAVPGAAGASMARQQGATPAGVDRGPGSLDVQSGVFNDQYQNGRLTATNRPPSPTESKPSNHLEEARKLLGNPPPAFYVGAHGQQLPNPQRAAYDRAATALALDMHKDDRQQKAIDAREKAKAQGDHADKWLTNKSNHVKQLVTEWQSANPEAGKALKPEVRAKIEDQAKEMADQDHVDAYGEQHLPESRKAARAKAAAPTPPPSPAAIQRAQTDPAFAAQHPEIGQQAAPPAAAPQQTGPNVVPVSPELKAKYDAINAAHGAEHTAAGERDKSEAERKRRMTDMSGSPF